jgi:23S rRNA G2069 N7-methylase RlmK/C1962 C5-methylase RlmI
MVSASELLKEGRKIVEQGWCQKRMACDASGNSIAAYSPDATCWCVIGGLSSVAHKMFDVDALSMEQFKTCWVAQEAFRDANNISSGLATWNDRSDTTKEMVLEAFDKAIKYAEEKGT